jgi:hypothetical protein
MPKMISYLHAEDLLEPRNSHLGVLDPEHGVVELGVSAESLAHWPRC